MNAVSRTRGPAGQKVGNGKSRRDYKTKAERKHLSDVAGLPCLVCGRWPVEVHHDRPNGAPRDHMKVLPLCVSHHKREYGPGAYHYSPAAFYEAHGDSKALLKRVDEMIAAQEDQSLGEWF